MNAEGTFIRDEVEADDHLLSVTLLDAKHVQGRSVEDVTLPANEEMSTMGGFMLAYAVDDPETWSTAKALGAALLASELMIPPRPLILVGSKCDVPEEERRVSALEGETFAESISAEFMEVSSKDDVNVEESLVWLATKALHFMPLKEGMLGKSTEAPGAKIQMRWFVLRTKTLCYYKTEPKVSKSMFGGLSFPPPLGETRVEDIDHLDWPDGKGGGGRALDIRVSKYDKKGKGTLNEPRTYRLTARDVHELQDWALCIVDKSDLPETFVPNDKVEALLSIDAGIVSGRPSSFSRPRRDIDEMDPLSEGEE